MCGLQEGANVKVWVPRGGAKLKCEQNVKVFFLREGGEVKVWGFREGASKSVGFQRGSKYKCGFAKREQVKVLGFREGASKSVSSPRGSK